MIDLARAGERLRQTAGPPTSIAALHERSRRRRRKRRVTRLVAAAVVVAVAVAIAAVVVGSDRSKDGQDVITSPQPRPSTTGRVITVPISPHPTGSLPLDYGRLQLWLPPGWYNEISSVSPCEVGPHADHLVLVGSNCHDHLGGDYVVVGPASAAIPDGDRRVDVNGIPTYRPTPPSAGARTLQSWAVPELGARLTFLGSGAETVAQTLGRSSLTAVLRLKRPTGVPSTWKTVSFGGLTADVPPDSTVERTLSSCGGGPFDTGRSPIVILGSRPGIPILCPPRSASIDVIPTDGLWLPGAPLARLKGTIGTLVDDLETEAGRVHVISTPLSGPIVQVTVSALGREVAAEVSVGTDPVVAEEIISSLRLTGTEAAPRQPAATLHPRSRTLQGAGTPCQGSMDEVSPRPMCT